MKRLMISVPIGAKVSLNGKQYECIGIEQRKSQRYDCQGCDLYGTDINCNSLHCTGDVRKDGQWVIFKEVKNGRKN